MKQLAVTIIVFMFWVLGFGFWGSGFWGSGFWVLGVGFRVPGFVQPFKHRSKSLNLKLYKLIVLSRFSELNNYTDTAAVV